MDPGTDGRKSTFRTTTHVKSTRHRSTLATLHTDEALRLHYYLPTTRSQRSRHDMSQCNLQAIVTTTDGCLRTRWPILDSHQHQDHEAASETQTTINSTGLGWSDVLIDFGRFGIHVSLIPDETACRALNSQPVLWRGL